MDPFLGYSLIQNDLGTYQFTKNTEFFENVSWNYGVMVSYDFIKETLAWLDKYLGPVKR